MPIKSRSELVRKTTTKAADDVEKQNNIKKRKLEEQEILQSDDEVVAAVINKINKRKRDEQEFKKAKVENKRKRKEQEIIQESSCYEGEDRFSSLPESLRLHILSSLDTKKAVQTSALSKSFKSSWASVPVLNFHSLNYFKRTQVRVFDKFVETVLSKRDRSSSLKRLSFARAGSCSTKMLKSVFGYVLSHGVKEFIAEIDGSSTSKRRAWPDFLTSTDSLTSLTLKSYKEDLDCLFLGPQVESRFFKNLSVLNLKRGIIKDLEPFSGCPVLEKLTLIDCRVETDENVLDINALNLSELSISYDLDYRYNIHPVCLNLTTPKLKFFEFRSYSFPLSFQTHTNLPILETVVLEFPGRASYSKDNTKKMKNLLSMLRAVHHVYSSFAVSFDSVVMQLSLFEFSLRYPFEKLKLDLKHNLKDHHHEKFLNKTGRWLSESLERRPLMDDHSCSVMMRI